MTFSCFIFSYFGGFPLFFLLRCFSQVGRGGPHALGSLGLALMEKGSWEAVRFPINIWEKVVGAS